MRPAIAAKFHASRAGKHTTWRALGALARTGTLRQLAAGGFAGVKASKRADDPDSTAFIVEKAFQDARCTPYQAMIIVLLGVSWAVIAVAVFVPVFAQAEPEWQCAPPAVGVCHSNSSLCSMDTASWEFADVNANIGSEWNLVCDRQWLNQMPSSSFFAGKMIGGAALGSMADRWGRKPVFFAAGCLGFGGSVVAAVAPGVWTYAVSRLVVGMSAGGSTVAFVLSSELVATRWRTVTGVLVSAGGRAGCCGRGCVFTGIARSSVLAVAR